LKKCTPTTWPGRDVTAAIFTSGMDEVLEASTASGRTTRSSRRNRSSLSASSSGRRLDDQLAVLEVRVVRRPGEAPQHVVALLGGQPPLVDGAAERGLEPVAAGLGGRGGDLEHDDAAAGRALTSAMPAPMIPAPTTPTSVSVTART
jgi:hypothetical protein